MAIHHINCRATASGLDNLAAIFDAMAWLSGDKDQIMVDQTTSYHGSIINIVTVKIEKNRQIKQFTEKLRLGDLDQIIQGISERIDDSNTLHLRLCLDSLVNQQIEFITSNKKSVKCTMKIKVYPGQDPIDNITQYLSGQH
tara:strand:- start:4585 stop:5007 length:423 start_codon:yes stop_codon:yes gene_type:complete